MKKSLSLILLGVFTSVTVQAVEVFDPQNILSSVKTHTHGKEFKEAFVCGTSYDYSANTTNCEVKCNNNYCMDKCYGQDTPTGRIKTKLYVENCTDTSVSIYGDNGWALEVTKEDYERGQNTLLIPMLKNLGHFIQPEGDVTINFLIPMGQYDYVHDGIKERIGTISVDAEIDTGSLSKPGVQIVLSDLGSGVPQILLLSYDRSEFLRLKGLFDVKY